MSPMLHRNGIKSMIVKNLKLTCYNR
jgi:hypothetical protein